MRQRTAGCRGEAAARLVKPERRLQVQRSSNFGDMSSPRGKFFPLCTQDDERSSTLILSWCASRVNRLRGVHVSSPPTRSNAVMSHTRTT